MPNKHIKNRPKKARAGLATARLLCGKGQNLEPLSLGR